MTIDTSNKNDTSSSSLKKNKQPQRGTGIKKLERLRLQERWNMTTNGVVNLPLPFNNTFAVPHHQLNWPFQFRQPPVNYFNGVVGDHHHHQHVYQNMTTNELSDSRGACYKKNRINGGGSSTCSVNPYRNYAANSSAFFETIDTARPRRVEVREVKEVKEVMPVSCNGMSLKTEHECFLGKNSKL